MGGHQPVRGSRQATRQATRRDAESVRLMAVDSETITAALSAAFPELYVEVNVREGSCGAFVDLVVVSPGFEGAIHAISMQAST